MILESAGCGWSVNPRWTQVKQCSGSKGKLCNGVDMCNREQHAAVKRTLPFSPKNLGCENLTEMAICSEEDVLNCTFESCDTEGKGEVYVSRIIAYLEDVTGQSCEKGQLRMLHRMLNPEERDVAVNLGTFHNVMKQWIAECREEGLSSGKNEESKAKDNMCILHTDKKSDASSGQLEGYGGDVNRGSLEATELINNIECLEYTNRRLMDQGAKLQRTVEGFEEANVRLTEEIFELKTKLKSSQQAIQHVKLLENEMEDLKSIMKNLEDNNYKLQTQNRQLEKENQNLDTSISQLQEENQIYEAKGLISVKDALLSEKINQSEEMKSTVDEYNDIIQGLKDEINKLQYHLTCEDLSVRPFGIQDVQLQTPIPPVRAPEYSLQLEIEEIQQRSDVASNNLPTPLCGTLPLHNSARLIKNIMYDSCSQLNWVAFRTIAEDLLMQQDIEEETKEFLQKFGHLLYAKVIWDMYTGNLTPRLTAVMQRYHPAERDSCTRSYIIKYNEDSMAECMKPGLQLRHIGEELKVVPGAAHRLELGLSPALYIQREDNTRYATLAETLQVQITCQGMNDNIGEQQSNLELLYDELFSSEQKHEGNICIRWNMTQSELAAQAADEQHENHSAPSILFHSQIKNICLLGFLLVFTMMLVVFSSFFSLFHWSCQKYSIAECTDSSFWSLLKALLCPQIRVRYAAPPPV
ncbi:uncharacterized protein LOC129694990 isoform X5 [Leucoraja erinacea]|uniref:uncharacterized protein LOC129694990 isoform X5 n=1 Tax=Leucoraja erinaceus TaxID=7782 RepID=UPI002455B672|nr:uncharacterized protein LOC129694990 isoform X5 [Leucoraja erinacea]